jgi:hypothetical protein
MSAQRSRALSWLLPLILVLAVVCIVVIVVASRSSPRPYSPPRIAFDGSSDELKQTVIVPTLDTPMPEGKNVIWCASFQIAWNEFRDDVIGEPVKIEGAQDIADRLNASTITADVLEPDDYYAKAGQVKAGVVEEIRRDMAAQFPNVTIAEFHVEDPLLVAVMYGYLAANVKFTIPFYENQGEFLFGGVPVSSFGISRKDRRAPDDLREQIEVLYYSGDPGDSTQPEDEFAVDPCRHSRPYQLILARIAPKASLAETLSDLDAKLAGSETSGFLDNEVLLIPSMHWRTTHRFLDLEDLFLKNEGHTDTWLEDLYQRIDFRLDRSGADVKSESWGSQKKSACGDRRLIFDRPFLIVMKKRGAERPFFVMWVDNAELLCKP